MILVHENNGEDDCIMMTIRIILQDLYKVVWQWLKDVPNNYQNHLMAKENNFLMSRADKIP
jgi:hypothetical protein